MGWIDREHIPAIEQDDRYTRLINLTLRLLEERVPTCGNCTSGQVTVQDADGNKTTMPCPQCEGTGTLPTRADNEDNGQAGSGR